jgi:hypothetical protein
VDESDDGKGLVGAAFFGEVEIDLLLGVVGAGIGLVEVEFDLVFFGGVECVLSLGGEGSAVVDEALGFLPQSPNRGAQRGMLDRFLCWISGGLEHYKSLLVKAPARVFAFVVLLLFSKQCEQTAWDEWHSVKGMDVDFGGAGACGRRSGVEVAAGGRGVRRSSWVCFPGLFAVYPGLPRLGSVRPGLR